jgi:hypothetical protein
MVGPVRQALFKFGYRYVRECRGELFEGELSHRIEIRIIESLLEYSDYSIHG